MAASESQGTLRKKVDRFWATLFLTPDGKPKSATLLYSFCLSLVYLAVYGVAYYLLIDIIERAFAGSAVFVRNLLESVVPGLAGTIVCCSLWFVIKNRRIVPGAYVFLTVFAVISIVTMALLVDGESLRIFLYFFLMLVPTGLISGTAFSFLMFRAHLNAEDAA